MTKNIQVSFRLSKFQLAHGLEILRSLEPTYTPSSITAMVKLIVEDWIAKMGSATKPWPSVESQQEIAKIMTRTAAGRQALQRKTNSDVELALIAKEVKQAAVADYRPISFDNSQINQANQASIEVHQPDQPTASQTKVVTDFSPPSFEELQEGEAENE